MTFAGLRAIGLIAFSVSLLAGCNSRPASAPSVRTVARQADPTELLVQTVRDELRKSGDTAATRRLIEQVNSSLAGGPSDRRPTELSADERKLLRSELGLKPNEMAEVERAEFTSADAAYLDEVLLLREAARSLDVDSRSPVERAEAAVAWVTRNLRGISAVGPAVPVTFAALRGAGTPVERTYCLFALLSQFGVDAALIGDPNAGPDGLWAVGVLAEDQIYLFDARLGLPLPGPDGKGVLTLAQLRRSVDALKPLALDSKLSYDVDPGRAHKSEILITAPMAGLTGRMRFLQKLIGEDIVRLTVDLAGRRDRFKAAAGGATVRIWNSQAPDALPRLLFGFLPASEGGGDTSTPARLAVYYRGEIPFDLLPPFLRELQGEPGTRIISHFRALSTGLQMPGQAHDLILRGKFREATDQLVTVQSQVKHRPGNPTELMKNAEDWATAARQYAAALSRQQRGALEPDAAEKMAHDKNTAERLWQNPRGPLMLLQFLVSDTLAAQTTYMLGQCKHEEAERLSHGDSAGAAWSTAQQWWRSFLGAYPNHPWAPAARRNLARALEAAGQRPAARVEYTSAAESAPTPLERLACRYLAEELK
jgi:hypothetical protein